MAQDHRVTFPDELYKYIQLREKQTGMSVPEYIRHLVFNDVKDMMELDHKVSVAGAISPEKSETLEVSMGDREQALAKVEDLKFAKFTVLEDDEDIAQHIAQKESEEGSQD